VYRKGKEIGATFSGAFSVLGLLDAVADVYNGVSRADTKNEKDVDCV
jgi:hypothetical protein